MYLYNTIFFPKRWPLNLLTFFVGLLGIIGVLILRQKLFIISFPFIFHVVLFFVIGEEARRAIPAQPFLLFSAFLVMVCIFAAIVKRHSFSETLSDIFK
jgi:hypothetical protein